MWLAAAMKKSIGIESIKFTREARSAFLASAAISGGVGFPVSADSFVMRMISFWQGQMIAWTLIIMMMPRIPPIQIALSPVPESEGAT